MTQQRRWLMMNEHLEQSLGSPQKRVRVPSAIRPALALSLRRPRSQRESAEPRTSLSPDLTTLLTPKSPRRPESPGVLRRMSSAAFRRALSARASGPASPEKAVFGTPRTDSTGSPKTPRSPYSAALTATPSSEEPSDEDESSCVTEALAT